MRLSLLIAALLLTLEYQSVARAAPTRIVTGDLIANRSVTLATRIMGRITPINATESDRVESGQVIADVTEDGTQVRISDLALFKDTCEPEKVRSRMNGQPAISFVVYKKDTADIIRTVDRIKAFIERNRHRLPD